MFDKDIAKSVADNLGLTWSAMESQVEKYFQLLGKKVSSEDFKKTENEISDRSLSLLALHFLVSKGRLIDPTEFARMSDMSNEQYFETFRKLQGIAIRKVEILSLLKVCKYIECF